MKLFRDYTKPGKGIDPNEKPKPAFIRYWIILWNKRFKLMGTNLMYILLNFISPVLASGSFFVAYSLYATMSGTTVAELLSTKSASMIFLWTLLFVAIYFTVIPVFSVGPSFAGCTFIYRSFTREEPVFLWSDYKDKMKTNLGLSLKVMLTNAFAGFVLMVDIAAYMAVTDNRTGAFPALPTALMFIVAIIIFFAMAMLVMLSMYIYPMMVTFKITYKQLYRNAMILCIARWLPNIGMMLLEAALIYAPILFIGGQENDFWWVIVAVLYLFITPAFFGFTNTFYVWPTIKKYMIDNPNADKSDKTPGDSGEKDEEKKETGRFENGRWVE